MIKLLKLQKTRIKLSEEVDSSPEGNLLGKLMTLGVDGKSLKFGEVRELKGKMEQALPSYLAGSNRPDSLGGED